ncbi:ISAzo13-like element transposase-related protein [Trichormus azollae]|uniref:ISAzo13-like element transposase-related protein n=1 Tax=Trichormus azollae TaxID=1164 RepID=UPI00325E7BB2
MEIPIPHYPPYSSKYNPIGHCFFPHISSLCQGLIFESVQTVEDLMATATTRTGLKLLTTILYNTYQTGQKVALDFKSNLKIVFDEFLRQWNYTPKPQLQVISSTILRYR